MMLQFLWIAMFLQKKLKRLRNVAKDLSIELTYPWKMKCEVIPLVIGNLGCITSTLLQRLTINKFCTLELLQRTAILGSSYIKIFT